MKRRRKKHKCIDFVGTDLHKKNFPFFFALPSTVSVNPFLLHKTIKVWFLKGIFFSPYCSRGFEEIKCWNLEKVGKRREMYTYLCVYTGFLHILLSLRCAMATIKMKNSHFCLGKYNSNAFRNAVVLFFSPFYYRHQFIKWQTNTTLTFKPMEACKMLFTQST